MSGAELLLQPVQAEPEPSWCFYFGVFSVPFPALLLPLPLVWWWRWCTPAANQTGAAELLRLATGGSFVDFEVPVLRKVQPSGWTLWTLWTLWTFAASQETQAEA